MLSMYEDIPIERNKLNKAKPLISCVLEVVTMQV